MLTTMERDQEETAKEAAEEADHVVLAQEPQSEVVPEVEPIELITATITEEIPEVSNSSDSELSHERQSPEVR